MNKLKDSKPTEYHHRGKTSEKLLDKKEIINALEISKGQTILDAGCGDGYMAMEFANIVGHTGQIYAIDIDDISIETLQAKTNANTIKAFIGDITMKTEIDTESIDLIYLSTVMHGFSETQMQGFLTEVNRLLKPKGQLIILEIKKENASFGPPLNIRLSPEDLGKKIPLTATKTIDIGEYFYIQIFEK